MQPASSSLSEAAEIGGWLVALCHIRNPFLPEMGRNRPTHLSTGVAGSYLDDEGGGMVSSVSPDTSGVLLRLETSFGDGLLRPFNGLDTPFTSRSARTFFCVDL